MAHQIKKKLGLTLQANKAEFRVWAPFAQAVSIIGTFTTEGPLAMVSENDGYWSLSTKGVEPGQQYRYQITTQSGDIIEKNDPRARAITNSDNGFSVVVDESFDWGDSDFRPLPKSDQVIYELHVGTFNRPDASTPGTFDTAIEKLDYLQDLGVTTIELMPITSMAFSNGWGYAPNYIFSVESMLGGRHGLMQFVKACHERNIGVILDVVYNHFYGDSDLWQFDGWSENNRGGIYFYNDERGDTPWGGRPDYGRPEVRQFILDNITMWLSEYRLDGLRIDSTIYMRNTAGNNDDPAHDIPEAWLLMQDIVSLAHKINPHALLIAEDYACNAYITKNRSEDGCGFDAQWELGFPHALRDGLGLSYGVEPTLGSFRQELEHSYNGDAFEKIIFSDSHDTAANGSARLNDIAAPENPTSLAARQKSLLAASLMLTSPGIPMLLQGAEFLQGGAFNDWQALEWGHLNHHAGFTEAHKHLVALRRNAYNNTGGLSGQITKVFHQNDDNHIIGFERRTGSEKPDTTLVLANFSNNSFDSYTVVLPEPGGWQVRFNSTWKGYANDFPEKLFSTVETDENGIANVAIAPYMVIIASKD